MAWIELTNAVSHFLPPTLPDEDGGYLDRAEVWANLRRWGHPLGHAHRVNGHDPDCCTDIFGVAQSATKALLSHTTVAEKLVDYADYLEDWVMFCDAAPPVSFLDESRWRDFLEERAHFSPQGEYSCDD